MEENELIKYIYAKHNELESLKKFIKDEHTLEIITAKQDTLRDMESVLDAEVTRRIMSM